MMRPQESALFLLFALTLSSCAGNNSGSGGSTTTPPPSNPVPTVTTISPNSSQQGGPAFTLSVVGANFLATSQVQWNGTTMPTTFVSSALITADVPATAISTARATVVAVTNPSPGGGTSNTVDFAVPCTIPSPAPAASQTRARLGAYYFDGWSGPLTNFHFQGMPLGAYTGREPVSGWQDNSSCAVEQQLALAHNFGIDFFVFDWYFNAPINDPGENLNSALEIVHNLPDRHGMQYTILYVTGSPFDVSPADWTTAVNEWVGYMTDPAYLRINGTPALFVINVGETRRTFGSAAAVVAALAQLRSAAQAQGLAGVYVVGGFGVPDGSLGQDSLTDGFDIAQSDGYDAVAFYGYPFAPPPVSGNLLFSALSDSAHWTWDQARLHSALPFIPTAMDGWDPRPWDERESLTGDLMWYSRTPQEVATLFEDAIQWTESNPQFRPEPSPTPPLVLMEAWNELGEGSHIVPTISEGTTYGDALATMLQGP